MSAAVGGKCAQHPTGRTSTLGEPRTSADGGGPPALPPDGAGPSGVRLHRPRRRSVLYRVCWARQPLYGGFLYDVWGWHGKCRADRASLGAVETAAPRVPSRSLEQCLLWNPSRRGAARPTRVTTGRDGQPQTFFTSQLFTRSIRRPDRQPFFNPRNGRPPCPPARAPCHSQKAPIHTQRYHLRRGTCTFSSSPCRARGTRAR